MSLLKKKRGNRGTDQAIHLDEKRGYGNQKEMGVHAASYSHGDDRGASQAGEAVRAGVYKKQEIMSGAKEHHKEKLAELKSMNGPPSGESGFAQGGSVDCPTCCDGGPCEAHDGDMVSSVMGKRKMSKGGQVANEQGEGADGLPNEFDYLALSGGLEDNSGAGNEHGDSSLFEDTVAKVMLQRRKQHNPRPA